jgi:hypothetical protein
LLEEQKSYYDARAGEHDEWWERRGRYDLGSERNAQWREEIRKVTAIFDTAPSRAEKVTVLDDSQLMIEINGSRVQEAGLLGRVDYEKANLFDWRPHARYDSIFLSFWISHLPSAILNPLLLMASMLKPGGCLAILEGQRNGRLRSAAQGTSRLDDETELRTLNDSRTFRIVKRYDDPEELAERLERVGLETRVDSSGDEFLYALAFSPR